MDFQHHLSEKIKDLNSDKGVDITELAEFIDSQDNPFVVNNLFCSFRLFMHPFIDFEAGLIKRHKQVNLDKDIDHEYAECLASDLAFRIIDNHFQKKKQWPVDHSRMSDTHPLKKLVEHSVWPNSSAIQAFGDKWHLLPMTPCFDLPEHIPPATLYGDKSHSMQRTEVLQWVKNHSRGSIPPKKVLQTVLQQPATDIPAFLRKVNDSFFSIEDLLIGLKPKERELKIEGRYFALLTWALREYSVVTEYLIKEQILPLYQGLTMRDSMIEVLKKMMGGSDGQGLTTYEKIGIVNHIDYSNWNNHMRVESTGPVFKVLGSAWGLPHLFTATHRIFEESTIHYSERCDLLKVEDDQLVNSTDTLVCWKGQKGGLEGLRQKGWSLLSYLILERESRNRNTQVNKLAQGDDQIVRTLYKLPTCHDTEVLSQHIRDVIRHNDHIMDGVTRGSTKMGLVINRDETLQSAEILCYGKKILFRGNLLPPDCKAMFCKICTEIHILHTFQYKSTRTKDKKARAFLYKSIYI